MADSLNWKTYYEEYKKSGGAMRPNMLLPRLVIWVRRALNDDAAKAADFFNMDEDQREDFYSWGSNSRWMHTFNWQLKSLMKNKEEELCKTLDYIARTYNDPVVE